MIWARRTRAGSRGSFLIIPTSSRVFFHGASPPVFFCVLERQMFSKSMKTGNKKQQKFKKHILLYKLCKSKTI